jgi:hypothetical protein
MRTLTAGLIAEQSAGSWYGVKGIYKIVVDSQTYDETLILHMEYIEEPDSYRATIIIDNSEGSEVAAAHTFETLTLEGSPIDIYFGIEVNSREFSGGQCAPQWVKQQRNDVYAGIKVVVLECEGVPDRLNRDVASDFFRPEPADATVLKTYIQEMITGTSQAHPAWQASSNYVASYVVPTVPNGWYYYADGGVGMLSGTAEPTWPLGINATVADSALTWTAIGRANTVYSHCVAYTVTFDSAETTLTTHTPGRNIYIHPEDTRWEELQERLEVCQSVVRIENDDAIHIILPTVSGTAYDYTYDNASETTHTFIRKEHNQEHILPNRFNVSSMEDDALQYTASTVTDAGTLPLPVDDFYETYVASTTEAKTLATARRRKWELFTDKGAVLSSINIGQELYDFVKVNDAVGNTVTVGNVTRIRRVCSSIEFSQELQLGCADKSCDMPVVPRHVTSFDTFLPWFKTVLLPQLDGEARAIHNDRVAIHKRLDQHTHLTTRAHNGIPLTVVKSIDQTVISSTVMQNDEALHIPVAASAKWGFHMAICSSSGTAPDIKFGFSIPANATMAWTFMGQNVGGADVIVTGLSGTSVQTAAGVGADATYLIDGILFVAGTAGTFNFQWAQNTSSTATTKVKAASFMSLHKVVL